MQVDPLDAPEEPDSGPTPMRELAELSGSDEEGGRSKASARLRVVQFNQKDDYLHRGRNPLLRRMSMMMCSLFVRRVDRSKAGKPDGVRFFEFEKHYYPHFESSLQDPRRVFSLTALSSDFCIFYRSSSCFCFVVVRMWGQEVRSACPRVLHIAHALADTRAARDRSKDRAAPKGAASPGGSGVCCSRTPASGSAGRSR